MKKCFLLFAMALLISLPFFKPLVAGATEDVYYDLGGDSRLYMLAMVCKIANCINVGTPTDWKSYSTTSENIEGDAGPGDTLVVSPGDTLTFIGASKVEGVGTTIEPVYGIMFTNESYLTVDSAFGSVIEGVDYSDVDDDDIYFSLMTYDNITLSEPLIGAENPVGQYGAISATVNSDAPDGTVITGTFYVVDSGVELVGFGPQKARAADDYIRSTVRLLVSNPAQVVETTPTVTTNLPMTGADSKSQSPYYLVLASFIIITSMLTIVTLRRVKR